MKNYFSLWLIVLMSGLIIAITGCPEEMTNQVDHIINTDIPEDMADAGDTDDMADAGDAVIEEPVAPLPAGTVVFVEPRQVTSPATGQQLTVNINVKGAADVTAYEVTVGFDPTAFRYVSIANADYLPAGAFAAPPQVRADSVYLAATSVSGPTVAARGTLATVTFEVVSAKTSTITLNDVLLSDSNVTPLALGTANGKVQVP